MMYPDSIMPLDAAYVDKICKNVRYQYRRKIASSAL